MLIRVQKSKLNNAIILMFPNQLLYWASRPVVGTYTSTMLHMDVQLHAAFPAGAKIIAANHPSTTDPFFVAAILRQQSFILIKDLLFQVPVFGAYLRFSGHIPVSQGGGQAALDAALERLHQGCTVVIFPEGALSPLGSFCEPRTGVARLALLSGAPVIPVGIHLQSERTHDFRSTVGGQVEDSRWYLRGPYNMTVGQALRFTGNVEDRAHVRAVAGTVMHRIVELARESETRMNRPTAPLAPRPGSYAF